MYICLSCGRTFENPSIWKEPHGETTYGCPYCDDGFVEAVQCARCNNYFDEDDLCNGYCQHCAESEIDYENALSYFKDKKILRHFFLVWYWQICDYAPDTENEEVDNMFVAVFNQKVLEDKETFKTTFLEQIKEYILEDIFDWTEFLEKEVKANENTKS